MATEPTTIAVTVLKRLVLSRYLYELAAQNGRAERDVALSACVNLLQDSIEIFMVAGLDHLNANVGARTEFPQYLDKMNEALGEELPFRRRLLEINKVRVVSKHEGISPNQKEVEGYISDARKFLEQACKSVFDLDFWSVSLIQLLDGGEAKNLLHAAEGLFSEGDYGSCLVECRKAIFIEFESAYDTRKDLEGGVGLLFGSRAPYYARQPDYIEKHVRTPFDYVCIDHSQLDADLMKEGIDHTSFWNVWRLTPDVYRAGDKADWLVKHDPLKLESDGLRERAAYVLETTVEILLARQSQRRMTRSNKVATWYVAKLKKPNTNVFEKADRDGPICGNTGDLDAVDVHYATPGLRYDNTYWNVSHLRKGGPFLMGYILEEDLEFD